MILSAIKYNYNIHHVRFCCMRCWHKIYPLVSWQTCWMTHDNDDAHDTCSSPGLCAQCDDGLQRKTLTQKSSKVQLSARTLSIRVRGGGE